MPKRYDAVVERTRKALPAHIEFARKTIADKLGIRERTLRLTGHELSVAADKAAHASLRGEVEAVIAESPGFLYADIEGVHHSTIYDELVRVIARSITDDLKPELERVQADAYSGLNHEVLLGTCKAALAEMRGGTDPDLTGLPDRFEIALDEYAGPSRYGLMNLGAVLDDVVDRLRVAGNGELSRRLLEEGYHAFCNEDRFVEPRAPERVP